MKVKEAIEIICVGREKLLTVEDAHKVVNCLKQDEKYRQMWEEFKDLYGFKILYWAWEDMPKNVNEGMDKLEQKYFPKEG